MARGRPSSAKKPLCKHGERCNGKAKNKWKKRTPQARMAWMRFPLSRVPYRFEVSPLKVGEKTMARGMMSALRAGDLLLFDRGFWSFGLFWDVQNRGAFFGIRLVAKVKLKTLRRLGPGDRIVRYAPADPTAIRIDRFKPAPRYESAVATTVGTHCQPRRSTSSRPQLSPT